jgi:hypothetical protein
MFYVQPLIQTKYFLLVLNVRSMFDALLRSPSMKPLPEAVSLMSLEAQQQVEAALHVMICVCVCVRAYMSHVPCFAILHRAVRLCPGRVG